MDRVIRVAQIIGKAINGGTEAFAMNYYTHIDRSKVQFDFFVESTSKIIDRELIESLGGRVVIIPSYKNPFNYIKILTKLFKDGNYDIVHSNMNALSVFTLRAAKKAGVPIRIAHSHSTSNKKEWKKTIIKNLLKPLSKIYATHYFACSELAGRWLFGNKTFDKGQVKVINNAIELDRFKFDEDLRKSTRRELGIEDDVVIGNIGRFCEQKNHNFLIDVFNEYQKIVPLSKLLLVGNGGLENQIREKVDKLGLTDKVIFAGVHKNSEKFYNAMDCFVLPSLYEGLGMVAVEAQVSGLPCVISDHVPNDVKINDNVYQLKLNNVKDWSNMLQGCAGLRSCSYMESFKKAGYDIVHESNSLCLLYISLCGDFS